MAFAALLAGCVEEEVPEQFRIPGADAERGRQVIADIACGVCHAIPGIAGADGAVGPSLAGFGARNFIAGRMPNRPAALARFVRDAPSVDPETAMPSLPLNEAEARDVAAYLYTLR